VNEARTNGWQEGLNAVGNMWFDSLLDRMPETFAPLVSHTSVRPYLNALYGAQCRLRSLRAHINPGPYKQECISTSTDTGGSRTAPGTRAAPPGLTPPTTSRITAGHRESDVREGRPSYSTARRSRQAERLAVSEPAFNAWCDSLEHETIYPKAGDCVLFFSNIPHRGAKEDPDSGTFQRRGPLPERPVLRRGATCEPAEFSGDLSARDAAG